MRIKNKRLNFMLPEGLSKGNIPIMAQGFVGSLPDGVYASWSMLLPNGEEKKGKRLAGDFFIPSQIGTLGPRQTITLEIECEKEEDIPTPALKSLVRSQEFFYLASRLTPSLPPELAAMVKDPREREALARQFDPSSRPQTSDEIDPTRVELVEEKSMTIAHYKERAGELGQPIAAMLEVEIQPENHTKSSLILLQ